METKIKRGQILKDLRTKKGLKQSELADMLGITQQAYQRYEYGTSEPNADGYMYLSNFYGVTTDYLLGRETEEQSALDTLVGEFDMSLLEKKILEEYLKLPKTVRGDMVAFLHRAVLEVEGAEPPISEDEQQVINMYRDLNKEGKEKAADNIDDLVTSGKYKKKPDQNTMGNIA